MVVRDTFLAELKTLFGLVVAGFEPGFSDPKARALPLRQSYAVKIHIILSIFEDTAKYDVDCRLWTSCQGR